MRLFADVAALFIEATSSYVVDETLEFIIGDDYLGIEIEAGDGMLKLSAGQGEISLHPTDAMYLPILEAAFSLKRSRN